MNDIEPNKCVEKYELNISDEDLINTYVKDWVLLWCEKYHPEAFEEAENFNRPIVEKDGKKEHFSIQKHERKMDQRRANAK